MTKSIRVKIFRSEKCNEKVRVYMKESNVSQYAPFTQFVELQNGASSGDDVKGNIYYGVKASLYFRAGNPGIGYPWFEVTGKDGKGHSHNFYEDETWDTKIDGVFYSIKRLKDGDGCKLFEMRIQGE